MSNPNNIKGNIKALLGCRFARIAGSASIFVA
jgi:hypothetical protein